jgi:hypothetical protein
VKAIPSKRVLRSPDLKILKILESLKALSAEKAPPPSLPALYANVSTKLIMTISASKMLNLSEAKPETPSPVTLITTSTVKITVKKVLPTSNTL